MHGHRRVGAAFVALFLTLGIASLVLDRVARVKAAGVMAPRFEVDPLWPKPLPNHWLLGNAIGVAVDSNDHIWIVHRQQSLEAMENYASANPPGPKRRAGVVEAECCEPAPPVLEFDEAGNLIGHWGGPGEGYDWPETNHGIFIDYKGNVWIGGNGRPAPGNAGRAGGGAGGGRPGGGRAAGGARGAADESQPAPGYYNDNMILKFTQSGKFLMQIGKPGQSKGSNDVENLKGPAKMHVDPKTDELYVADMWPMDTAITASSSSTLRPANTNATGALTAISPTTLPWAATSPTTRPRSSFAIPCTAPNSPTTACFMFATAPTTASRSSNRMGLS